MFNAEKSYPSHDLIEKFDNKYIRIFLSNIYLLVNNLIK